MMDNKHRLSKIIRGSRELSRALRAYDKPWNRRVENLARTEVGLFFQNLDAQVNLPQGNLPMPGWPPRYAKVPIRVLQKDVLDLIRNWLKSDKDTPPPVSIKAWCARLDCVARFLNKRLSETGKAHETPL